MPKNTRVQKTRTMKNKHGKTNLSYLTLPVLFSGLEKSEIPELWDL